MHARGGQKRPAAHGIGAVDPAGQYWPAGQSLGPAAPGGRYVPQAGVQQAEELSTTQSLSLQLLDDLSLLHR